MIELVRHIEILLLENDCVVVPGFGGFIAHYMPASWSDEECVFLPPVRTVGFNAQLKMNDGVLVQSYMEAYTTNFSDATRILENAVHELVDMLHKEGKVDFSIGEITLSVYGTYTFAPYNDRLLSPALYGLDTLDMKELAALEKSQPERNLVVVPQTAASKRNYEIRINRSFIRNAVAVVAAILLFFYMSDTVENTYVENVNYAQLLPADLFGKIEGQSLLTTPIGGWTETEQDNRQVKAVPVTVKEVKVPKVEVKEEAVPTTKEATQQPASKRHHIIIASVAHEDDAQATVEELKSKGYKDACVLTGDGKIRISLISYPTREEADNRLAELRKDNAYKNAWLLVR